MPHRRTRRLRWIVALTLVALATIAVLSATPWPASSYRHTDFFQFWASAQALLEGASPYDRSWYEAFAERVGSRALEFWPAGWVSPYPLWTDLLTLPLPLLPYRIAAATWLVLQVLGLAVVVGLLGRRMTGASAPYLGLALGAIAITFQPFWGVVGGGNIAGFVAVVWGGAVASALAGHGLVAGGLVGLLIAKPQLSIALTPLLVVVAPAKQRRPILLGALCVSGALALVSLAVRPTWPLEWARPEIVQRMSTESNATVWTLDRVLPASFGGALAPLVIATLVVTLVITWWWRQRPAVAATVAGGTALALFVAPHARHYDQVLLLVTAALLIGQIADLAARLRVVATAVAATIFIVVPWILYAIAVDRGAPRAVVDLHEEWNALLPLFALALVIGADMLRAPSAHEVHRRTATSRIRADRPTT